MPVPRLQVVVPLVPLPLMPLALVPAGAVDVAVPPVGVRAVQWGWPGAGVVVSLGVTLP